MLRWRYRFDIWRTGINNRWAEILLFLNEITMWFCQQNTVREVIENTVLSCQPRDLYLSQSPMPREYETENLTKEDVKCRYKVVKRNHTKRPDRGKNGRAEKEIIKFLRPGQSKDCKTSQVPLNISNPLRHKIPNECTDRDCKEFYHQSIYGLPGLCLLDPYGYGLSVSI